MNISMFNLHAAVFKKGNRRIVEQKIPKSFGLNVELLGIVLVYK